MISLLSILPCLIILSNINLTELIEKKTFNREGSLFLACNEMRVFFSTFEQHKRYQLRSCQKMCDVLHNLLDNMLVRFCSKLYRQIVCIAMGTNCAPLVADLFLFCYERDFALSLSDNNRADVIETFYSIPRYLDDVLNNNSLFRANGRSDISHWTSV